MKEWTLDRAVKEVSNYTLTSTGSLSRIEALATIPTVRNRRVVAIIASILYGIDPKTLGLDVSELPRHVAVAIGISESTCIRYTQVEMFATAA